ncbi:MAG: type III pantothenate kinase [Acidobacteriota bacterium]
MATDPRAPSQGASDSAPEQVVLFDVGNSNTVVGVLFGGVLRHSLRLATVLERTADELSSLLLPLFGRMGLNPAATDGCVVASVVPPLNGVISKLAEGLLGVEAVFVGPGIKTGMPIRYDNPSEVGADRIVNALGAREIYGAPAVVVDLGTATTFDVVSARGEYLGGIIAPGIGISAEALFVQASKLFRVDLRRPDDLIGRSTRGAMRSGIFHGALGMVDGILERLSQEQSRAGGLGTVVCTGGAASWIAEESAFIDRVDEDLTLLGLQRIFERNRRLIVKRPS